MGNYIGCWLISFLLKVTNYCSEYVTGKLSIICSSKMSESVFLTLLLSVAYGMLMFILVNAYFSSIGIEKFLGVFICIPVFIFCGFEHSIANMFFTSLNDSNYIIDYKTFLFLIICTVGNALGAVIIPLFNKIIQGSFINADKN